MATRVISPENLREISKLCKLKSQESLIIKNQLDGMQNLQDGPILQKLESWKLNLQDHAELLNNIGLEMERIANTMEETVTYIQLKSK